MDADTRIPDGISIVQPERQPVVIGVVRPS